MVQEGVITSCKSSQRKENEPWLVMFCHHLRCSLTSFFLIRNTKASILMGNAIIFYAPWLFSYYDLGLLQLFYPDGRTALLAQRLHWFIADRCFFFFFWIVLSLIQQHRILSYDEYCVKYLVVWWLLYEVVSLSYVFSWWSELSYLFIHSVVIVEPNIFPISLSISSLYLDNKKIAHIPNN